MDIFTLVFLVLAVVIILKLRSVLGRKTGDDEARVERYRAEERARAASAAQAKDKVVALPRRERAEAASDAAQPASVDNREARVRELTTGNPPLAESLMTLVRAERNFDPDEFLKGASKAYEMIVTAFAEGNRGTLKDLLSREVYDGFVGAIAERESRGALIDQSFVGINKADIVEVDLKGKMANISVRFVSELITATRDKEGTVISGDPKKIKEVIDIWTFAREINSRYPNWTLIATQAPN